MKKSSGIAQLLKKPSGIAQLLKKPSGIARLLKKPSGISQRVGGPYPDVFEGTELIKSKPEKVSKK